VSVFHSIKYLQKALPKSDDMAVSAAHTGMVFGVLGIVTGMAWARYTWGAWWVNDPKLNGAAIALLIYSAYIILRNSMEDEGQRARISAIYNIFAFATLIPLLFILPRLTDSLHPGNGGNPGFSSYDLDSNMRKVFYPAVIGWTLLGAWITQLSYRIRTWQRRQENIANREVGV
jgi:heme exporter protein C